MEGQPAIPKPEDEILNEVETLDFLKNHGAIVVTENNWTGGVSIVYVLEDEYRDERFQDLPKEKRPTIARVEKPVSIIFSKTYKEGDAIIHPLSSGGKIFYFVINKKTGKLEESRKPSEPSNRSYFVKEGNIFLDKEDLFN